MTLNLNRPILQSIYQIKRTIRTKARIEIARQCDHSATILHTHRDTTMFQENIPFSTKMQIENVQEETFPEIHSAHTYVYIHTLYTLCHLLSAPRGTVHANSLIFPRFLPPPPRSLTHFEQMSEGIERARERETKKTREGERDRCRRSGGRQSNRTLFTSRLYLGLFAHTRERETETEGFDRRRAHTRCCYSRSSPSLFLPSSIRVRPLASKIVAVKRRRVRSNFLLSPSLSLSVYPPKTPPRDRSWARPRALASALSAVFARLLAAPFRSGFRRMETSSFAFFLFSLRLSFARSCSCRCWMVG